MERAGIEPTIYSKYNA